LNIYASKGAILKRPLYTVVPLTVSEIVCTLKDCLGKMAYVDGKIDSQHILLEMYYKSTHQDSKDRIINEFKKGDSHIRCIVATVALGMGLDIRDVDLSHAHWMPQNPCHTSRRAVVVPEMGELDIV
jgi:RecG-like helicase